MEFSDISSYSDDQVAPMLLKLESDDKFHDYISKLIYPNSPNILSGFLKLYTKKKFKKIFTNCNSIDEFQNRMAPFVKKMIDKTTDGFSFTGLENLKDRPTLFISNHRDISLDAAFLNYLLFSQRLKTVRIAIGDNLLDGGFAEILMRLNKSFVVHRNIQGVKETMRKLSKLSAYINHSLFNEGESIWIAQKEGRANDGNDFTDESVLKMLYLEERKRIPLKKWVQSINLTPVAISYEYDPLDKVKAVGWDFQKNWSSEKINQNDLEEMTTGIFGYKGKVHLHICSPITSEIENTEELANTIQDEIIQNYFIWPSSQAAAFLLDQSNFNSPLFDSSIENSNSVKLLKERFKDLEEAKQKEFLKIYARPLINKEKARLSSGL
mgnify:FL=1